MPPITVMIKPVSGACNMRCRYCFYADEMRARQTPLYPPMTREVLATLVRRVLRSAEGSAHFIFQGGEPTLAGLPFFEEFVRLERQYAPPGLAVTHAIQTNALSLSQPMIDFLARERFLVGVSLDGDVALHDSLRPDAGGRPTARTVLESLARLRDAGAEVNVLCVVTRQAAARPREVFEALAPYRYLQFIPCLEDPDRPGEFTPSGEEYLRFLTETFALYEAALTAGHPVSVRVFDNWLGILLGLPPENCAMNGRCSPCLVVEGDGSVFPCDFYAVDRWRLGNIAEDSLKKLLGSPLEAQFLAESLPVPDVCRACRWYALCRNGCKRERQEGVTRWCGAYRRFFEQAFPRMQALARLLAAQRNGQEEGRP